MEIVALSAFVMVQAALIGKSVWGSVKLFRESR
jgi:hypothetical protein